MEVFAVRPSGYCSGVLRAIAMAEEAKKEHPTVPIYCLGALVHNEATLRRMENLGIQTVQGCLPELETFLLSLAIQPGILIFSAHGHPLRWERIAKEKGLDILDCTCPVVEENRKTGTAFSSPFVYFGIAGHAESESFLANCPNAFFLDLSAKDAVSYSFPLTLLAGSCPVITQTTLSQEEIEKGVNFLRSKGKEPYLLRGPCSSSKLRQEAIDHLPGSTRLLLVLGSPTSNNSKKLVEKAKAKGIPALLLTDQSELNRISLPQNGLALACGASTSPQEFDDVLKRLESL